MVRSQPNPLEPSQQSYSIYRGSSSSSPCVDDIITCIVVDFDQENKKFDAKLFKM